MSGGVFLAAAFFAVLISLYSIHYMEKHDRLKEYYAYLLITLGAAAGVFFSSDFVSLLLFWGILAATLYLLVGIGGAKAGEAAKKTMVMVGGADAVMLFGIGLIFIINGNLRIGSGPIAVNGILPMLAFLAMMAGVSAKAGLIPLHTWIPEASEAAPMPVMAYLPASLDKLLGIYLLARLCMDVFIVEPNSPVSIILMAIGSLTIMIGVLAALVQHDLNKLLSFHAISQVGYMALGIGTGIPVAVAGGLFHMINHALYKSLLFLGAGTIEKQTGTTNLAKLGGLARVMPVTFICMVVGAFSISGVPPLNGFMSKWMIYQGIVELSKSSPLWIVWLLAATFGSALTLASFMKILHAAFLGQWSGHVKTSKEGDWMLLAPMVVLASVCIIFGIFAYQLPLKYFIVPVVGLLDFTGLWNPVLATALLFLGLLVGMAIYFVVGNVHLFVHKPSYVGGELIEEEHVKVTGAEFYHTIRETGPLEDIYRAAETREYDVYEIGRNLARVSSRFLSSLHDGALQTYTAWLLLGAAVLLIVLVR